MCCEFFGIHFKVKLITVLLGELRILVFDSYSNFASNFISFNQRRAEESPNVINEIIEIESLRLPYPGFQH